MTSGGEHSSGEKDDEDSTAKNLFEEPIQYSYNKTKKNCGKPLLVWPTARL